MNTFILKRLLLERLGVLCLALVLLVRTWQFFSLEVEGSTGGVSSAATSYYAHTGIALGVFVLTPLFLAWMLLPVRVIGKVNFCVRLKRRERVVSYFARFALVKAAAFAVLVNGTALILMAITCPLGVKVEDIMVLALVAVALEGLYFLVCALVLFAVFAFTKSIQGAAVTVLCYALWDYAASYIPYYATMLPRFGWQLTEIALPLEAAEVMGKAAFLLALIGVLTMVSLVAVRRSDMMETNGAEQHV